MRDLPGQARIGRGPDAPELRPRAGRARCRLRAHVPVIADLESANSRLRCLAWAFALDNGWGARSCRPQSPIGGAPGTTAFTVSTWHLGFMHVRPLNGN